MLTAVLILAVSQCPASVDQPPTVPAGISGTSVAIDGDLAVVGAPLGTGNAWASGVVLVYRNIGGVWEREADLAAADGGVGDMLGVSVDVDGDRIIAGAWFDDDYGSNSGAAYVFRFQKGEWLQEAKLTAPSASPEDAFGRTVAIEGPVIAVGAPLDDPLGPSSGSVTIFMHDVKGWFPSQALESDAGGGGDQFGLGLAMRGGRIIVGSPWADDARGRVDIFDQGDVTFFQTGSVTLPDAAPEDHLGFGVAVAGDQVLASAYGRAGNSGSLGVFHPVGEGWQLDQEISHPGVADEYGVSLAADGDMLLVGSRFEDGGGAVHILRRSAGAWAEASAFHADDPADAAEFGWSVALDGDDALVGELNRVPDGAAYFYTGMLQGCGCNEDIDGDGMIAVADLLAVISAWGSCDGCAEDINGDGVVAVADLLAVISAWGACP